MEIAASARTDGSSAYGIGNLLQMFTSVLGDQSTSTGINGQIDDAQANPFGDLLLQQIAALIESENTNDNPSAMAGGDILKVWENLLMGDLTAAEEALAELPLLALVAQTKTDSSPNQSIIPEDGLSTVMEGKTITGSSQDEVSLSAGQLTSWIVKDLQNRLKEEENNPTKTGFTAPGMNPSKASDPTAQKEASMRDQKGFIAEGDKQDRSAKDNALNGVMNSANNKTEFAGQMEDWLHLTKDEASELSVLKEQTASNTNMSGSKADTQSQQAAKSFQEFIDGAESNQSEAKLKSAVAAVPGEKSAAYQAKVESDLNKTGLNIKMILTGQISGSPEAEAAKTDGDGLKIHEGSDLDRQGPGKNVSAGAEAVLKERRMGMHGNETISNMSGKEISQGASTSQESQGVSERIKAELKGKGAPIEKNSEIHILNTQAASGGVQAKSEEGEISPSSIISRVAAEFREHLMTEGGRIKITLTPPSLGSLEMDVSVQNSKVKVMLIAENKDVQKILSGNLETLKGSLQSQGLTIERCDVMAQDRRDEYSQGFYGQQDFGRDQAARKRNFPQESIDEKPLTGPAALSIRPPAVRSSDTGSESISLFA